MVIKQLFKTLDFVTKHPLNAHRKAGAVRTFFRWQIGCRLVPGPVAVKFVNDSRLLVGRSMFGATGNIYTGLHEFEDMSFVLHMLRKDDLFVDVGANVGSYTILAGAVVGAHCLSFEPGLQAFNALLDNVSINRIGDYVNAQNIGIGHEDGEIHFTAGLDTINHVLAAGESAANVLTVPVKTLDTVCENYQPTLIKIDVEGFETNVIAGADKVLRQPNLLCVIMELNGNARRYGFDESALHQKVLSYGFQPYTYLPFERRLVPYTEGKTVTGNILYIRDISEVERRLATGPHFQINGKSV